MNSLLIYGAYGYTGQLVSREAVARGGTPILAGRDGDRLNRLATRLDCPARSFDLETADVASELEGVDAVLNCAGPFVETAVPLVEACLETGTAYLDITGELSVFERLRRRDDAARDAGITLLPGVGFEVVPSDCLLALLARELPAVESVSVGIAGSPSVSRGTALTLLGLLDQGGAVRRDGRLLAVPRTYQIREIDFGDGPQPAVSAPLGDLVTAAHSTGSETVTGYAGIPRLARPGLWLADDLAWLTTRAPIRRLLEGIIEQFVDGPSASTLATDRATVWANLRGDGRSITGRLHTPNPYALTAESAVSAAERVLGGVESGFQTPATAFGPQFALELTGTDLAVDGSTDTREAGAQSVED